MAETSTQDLFRRAVTEGDAAAMREGLERMLGLSGEGLSAEREHALRSPDYVMEMPQSRERVRGRDAMRRMQEEFPVSGGPSVRLRSVIGAARVWVAQATSDYGDGETWHVVVVVELDDDGLIVRETRYYTQAFEAPGWRAGFVETMD